MKAVKPGRHRQRMVLQKPQTPELFDSFGQPIPNYLAQGTFWVELVPLRGREAIIAKQVYAEATHQLNVRWIGSSLDLDPTDRWVRTDPVTQEVRTFGIVAASNVETRNRMYSVLVQEIQAPANIGATVTHGQ